MHAHPDDESINNGATMARYAAEGAHVTLVTCTLGERGEVIPPELGHLSGAALGGHRLGELREAMRALGVTDFRLLGGAGRYCDSGMMGLHNDDPRCFWQATSTRPRVCSPSYPGDPPPGTRHLRRTTAATATTDHIQAHRVAMRAPSSSSAERAGTSPSHWNARAPVRSP
ncbi:hypothetical protein GCM10023238_38190 [Streptomyces heliomycini]